MTDAEALKLSADAFKLARECWHHLKCRGLAKGELEEWDEFSNKRQEAWIWVAREMNRRIRDKAREDTGAK